MAYKPSSELPPGTQIAGFRVERVIGQGSRATVYEATQLSLNRRVALKVMHDPDAAERVRRLSWPEHGGAVSLYGVGDSEYGPWLAMRLVSGGTLVTARASLDDAAAALEAAHAEGVVHGDVSARNVLVENGRGYLSDFGLVDGEITAEDDRAAMERLQRERAPRHLPRAALAVVAFALVVAGVGVGLAVRGDDERMTEVPAAPEGTRAVGSDLAPGDIDGVDCMGRAPDGSSRACTVSQRTLGGDPVVVPVDGTIKSWAVRGARGTLAIQVLRGEGNELVQATKSGDEVVPDGNVHLFETDLPVREGDRIALSVAPGAAIGVRPGGSRDDALDRWFGPLLEPARPPESPAGTGLDRELLLRADVTPARAR
jgi:hypothetical protein